MDFIPLSSGKSSSFAKDSRKKENNDDRKRPHNRGGGGRPRESPTSKRSFTDDSQSPSSSKSVSSSSPFSRMTDPKLKQRMMNYLEKNKHKEYIDIDEMSRQLHSKYPEYGRKKLREFQRNVNAAFDKLQNEAMEEAEEANSAVMSGRNEVSQEDPSPELQIVANIINLTEDDEMNNHVDPVTKVNGPSMNSVLSDLYLPKTGSDQNNGTTIKEEEVMVVVGESQREMSEFERIKEKASMAAKGLKERPTRTPEDSRSSSNSPRPQTIAVKASNVNVESDIEVIETVSQPANSLPPSVQGSVSRFFKKQTSTPLGTAPTTATLDTPTSTKTSDNTPSQKRTLTKRRELPIAFPTVPKVTFSNIGGCHEAINELYKASRHLVIPQIYRQLGVPPPRGCILHGPPGCGKTLLANALAGTLGVQMVTVSGTELISGISGDSEGKIRSLFEQVKSSAPCILFIEGLDVIAKKRDSAQRDMEMRIVSQLIACLDDLNRTVEFEGEEGGEVFVIGATDRLEVIDPALRTGKRLEREIALGIPDTKARKMILEVMCRDFRFEESMDFDTLARLTPGYVGSDLRALITAAAGFAEDRYYLTTQKTFNASRSIEAGETNWSDCRNISQWLKSDESNRLDSLFITFSDFHSALKIVKPSAMKEGFATVPNVSFDDIGALDDIRRELEMAICAPVRHPELAHQLGLDVPSGVLLCGPPGCGKTLLAKAVANQAGINFLSVKGPEIMNMYVGESERAIRQIFQRARNSAPCVIFFDEIDSICPRRSTGTDGGSGSNRVVNQMLTEMDGVEGRKGVYVMGASNRVDMIDEAILRPGRLTNIFFVGLPDARGREDILRKLTKNWTKPKLAPDVDLGSLGRSDACSGFSGADLGNLVSRAAQFRMEELCGVAGSAQIIVEEAVVGLEHFKRAFGCVKPSVSGRLKKRYDIMRQTYSGGVAMSVVSGPSADSQMLPMEGVEEEEDQQTSAEKEASTTTALGQVDVDQPLKPSSVAAESSASPSSCSPAAKMRYLEMMEVRVKDSSDTILAGFSGYVTDVDGLTDHCTVRVGADRDIIVETTHLDPFIPEEGEMAKVLVEGGPLAAGKVVSVNEDDENARIEFPGGECLVVPLDQLCKVRI